MYIWTVLKYVSTTRKWNLRNSIYLCTYIYIYIYIYVLCNEVGALCSVRVIEAIEEYVIPWFRNVVENKVKASRNQLYVIIPELNPLIQVMRNIEANPGTKFTSSFQSCFPYDWKAKHRIRTKASTLRHYSKTDSLIQVVRNIQKESTNQLSEMYSDPEFHSGQFRNINPAITAM